MCLVSVEVKVQLDVEWVEVCPTLAYSLSRASAWSRADAASLSDSEVASWHVLLYCVRRGQSSMSVYVRDRDVCVCECMLATLQHTSSGLFPHELCIYLH